MDASSKIKLPVEGIPILPPDVTVPEKQVLRYTSHTKSYAIPPGQQPAEGDFEGLFLRETHVPKPQANLPQHIGEYTLTIEASVVTYGELNEASQRIGSLARDLDRFWAYACGEPLSPLGFQLSFTVTPQGWQSNLEALKDVFLNHCHQPFAVVQMNHQHWIAMPYFPLRPALRARDAYKKADPLVQALADLHFAALKMPLGEGRLFAFAKALELARKLLPGKNDPDREKSLGLPKGILKQSFHWLFDVGNNRFNTRHAVRGDSTAPKLQPQMSGQEIIDYQRDADLILRALVCQNLQLPTPNLIPAAEAERSEPCS